MKRILSLFLLVCLTSALSNVHISSATAKDVTIYVSIVSHNEEPNGLDHPNFVNDYESYEAFRNGAVDFANMIHEEGAKYNFQSDWNFLLAEQNHWDEFENTNGKNLLRWLEEDLDFAVDPHAHESTYSIADVAYLMEELGITPSNIVGGFIASPAEDSRVEDFQETIQGWQYNTSWKAAALWGAATGLHADDSDLHISGIWRAKDNENFTTHDEDSIPVIGNYTSSWEGLDDLVDKAKNGELDADEMYTATLMTDQEDFVDAEFIEEFRENLEKYQDETEDGLIEWVTLEEVLELWSEEYAENPNLYSYEEGALTNEDSTSNSTTSSSFTDIEGHWAEEVILTFYDMGVIQGKSPSTFAPNDSMTRAELLKVALLAGGYTPSSSETTSAFSDVNDDDWFMPYVAYAYKNSFIEGYADGSFKPNNSINRAEALAILLRVAGEETGSLSLGGQGQEFNDVDSTDWFYSYVMYARDTNIVEGYVDGSFGPEKNVTRAEFCTMAGRQFL